MTTVDLVYFNAGGGHRAAALALQAVIRQQRRHWQVRLVNLVDMLDPQGRFRELVGLAPEDLYNRRLARGWTLGLAQELKLLQGAIRLGHAAMLRRLVPHWRQAAPDLVVSLVPNFNRALCDSLVQALPHVPFVTVMTDMADLPPNFWLAQGLPQHLVCGTATALAQARAAGHPERLLHVASGMILRPEFYEPLAIDRAAERQALGLPPHQPTGVVMFGGHGSQAMLGIARRLSDTPLILLCGHNAELARRLRAQPAVAPRVVLEFTPDVRRFMAMGDFFVGKPGPGCLSEAVHLGLPIITVRNAFTMPQERFNADWVEDNGLGIVLRRFNRIVPAVHTLVDDLRAFRYRVARMHNLAVFEVPEILADVLATAAQRETAAALTRPAVMAIAA
ncbi:galactosyldiacylglycerol synthase [Ideonella sp. A 288]|uniref:galactosyldiacylglycerol synthase n=1 Tax=Ideonella sp. A 288 TaxID=1962181 RepID=UPI000B4C07C2